MKNSERKDKTKNQVIGCLNWTLNTRGGYGVSKLKEYGTQAVHRVSYWIHSDYTNITDIPKIDNNGNNLMVCHNCHNPFCFEPQHLQLKSDSKNNYDDKIDNDTLLQGEKNHSAKISEEIASEIKLNKFGKSIKERSKIYNVSYECVRNIDSNRTWSHLPDEDGNITLNVDNKSKMRLKRIEARDRIWTKEMFDEAKEKILNNSTVMPDYPNFCQDKPCRFWNKGKDKDGYGLIYMYGKEIKSHILACEIKNGYHRPKDMVTRHFCANKICCEISHLEFGTASENGQDNAKHGGAGCKLTSDQVLEIRDKFLQSNRRKLAEEYNVTRDIITKIVNRKSYKHVL